LQAAISKLHEKRSVLKRREKAFSDYTAGIGVRYSTLQVAALV